jgi:autotransporter-associated beta strand protein
MIQYFRTHRRIFATLMASLMAAWQIGQPLQAATYYWDTDGSNVGNLVDGTNLGGVGTWDIATSNWWPVPAGPLTLWGDTSADTAIFSGPFSALPTLNTVTLSGALTANQLRFNRSGYTLTGGTSLTLAGAGAGLFAGLGESATIDSVIAGTDGMTKMGGGSIRLTNPLNGYTGTTSIRNGTLIINSEAALGGTGAVSVLSDNSTPLNTNMIGFGGGSLVLDGTSGGFTFSRAINFEGRGPIGDRGAAIQSLGNNTLSGTLTSAVSPLPLSPTASFRNSRINSVNGTLTLSGTLNAGGTSATTFTSLGGVNSAGVGDYALTGVLTGTGSIEKSGAGTLFLNPSSTSGFSGTVRVGGSSFGQQSSVRVTQATVGGTSIFGANTISGDDPSAIDMNGGVLEFRNDGNLDFNALASGKNVYLRANSTFYTGPAAGGAAINGLTTLGTFRVAANTTGTFNSRNGYGMTLQAWTQESSNNNTTIANNMGGTLTFTGDAWNNADADPRNLTFSGNGNTRIVGNITATLGTGNGKQVIKQGTGELILNGTGGTFTGATIVEGGSLRITDFRSINNNTVAIRLGNAGTTAGNLIIGGTGAGTGTAAGLTTSKPILFNTTTGQSAIYANQAGVNPVILNGAITSIATTGNVNLGGSNTADNIINTALPVGGTGGLTKVGAGTWVLNAANLYAGATTIQAGTLKLRATAAASDVVPSAAANTIVFSSQGTAQTAGGTLEFRGFSGAATTETLGALTPTAGASTVRVLGNGAAANLIFTSLGATTAASSLNFDTSAASGGTVSFTTAPTAATATTLPGTANFQGHLYLNGANFADIVAGVVTAPTYGAAGNFRDAGPALVAATHNRLTTATASGAATISSLLTNNQTLTLSGNLVVSTGGILQSGGTASILSDSATSRLIQGVATATNVAIRVNLLADVLNLGNATNPVNISSTTTGGLTKNGAGTLVFFGTNAQTGTTTINEGKVSLNGAAARLSATSASLVIRQGATLELLAGVTTANAVVNALDGVGTISGQSGQTFTQNGGGTWNGVFSGTGFNITKAGGAATWSGLNAHTGVTTIGGTGLVTVDTMAIGGQSSGIGASSNDAANLVFNGSTAGIDYRGNIIDTALTLGSRSATTDRLFTLAAAATGANLTSTASNNNAIVWSNTGAIVNNTTANAILTFAGTSTGDNTFDPQIVDSSVGGIILGVTKSGAGQWNLGASNNTYTGITTLNEGILGLNNNGALSGNSPLLLAPTSATSAAILQMSGTFERNLAATATAGSGTVTFGGTTASTTGGVGFAAHSTPLTVAIGGVGSPTALTWGTGGFVGTGAVQNLVLNSTSALSSVDFKNAIDLGALARTINVLDNANTGADYATMSGDLSGTGGSLIKAGAGVLSLTGANSYTGNTTLSGGTLVVSSLGGSTGPSTSSVGAGNVTMNDANAIILGAAGAQAVNLVYVGAGEESDRKIRLNATGTNHANAIYADGSGALILKNVSNDMLAGAKTLSLRGSNAAGNMITSQLSNNGVDALSVTIDGGATWILTNSLNNYSGNTTASAGALGIGDNLALGVGTLVFNNGNVFAYGADRTIANAITHNNNINAGFLGDYSLTFSSTLNLAAGANNANTTTNNIVAGKTLTFAGGVTANSLTALRAWAIDGTGETIINGNFTTSTPFGVRFDLNGGGTLTLGTNGAASNFNQTSTAVDVDRGTLKFTANNAIPNFGAATPTTTAGVTSSTTIPVSSTAGLTVGQQFSVGGTVVGRILSIDSGTQFTANTAQTIPVSSTLTFSSSGGVILSPELATADTATINLNGTNQTINALTATTDGAVVIDNTSASPATFTFGANNSTVSITNTGARTITDSGAGALSIVKTGNTALTLPTGMTLSYQGSTSSTGGGSFTINSPLNGTTGLVATGNSTLALPGGLTAPGAITSIEVGGGSTLSLLDGTGSAISNLTNLNLGAGAGTATLNLNVGDSLATGDFLNTDTLTLVTTGTLNLANTVTFNLTDAGLNPATTYTLLNLMDGGITAFGAGNMIQGAMPGGFSGFTWTVTNNLVQLTTGTLITGNSYWRGLTNNTWNANADNWSTDKAGTIPAASIPGSGTDVVFAYDGIAAAPLTTTLEQNIKINSLTFEAGTTTPTSVTIAPGAVSTNRLEVAPQVATDGIRITAGGPAAVIISAPLRIGGLGAFQTWNVADAASVLTLSGGLQGEKDVTKTGSGKVTVSIAADNAFNSGNTADFTINGGNLEILSIDALGVTSKRANVAVNTGGAFYFNNATAGTVTNALTLGGGTLSAGGNGQTYSGAVNVSANSTINMADSNTALTGTARNITLSGVVSGAGNLTIDGNNTASTGNQVGGTLTLSNAASTWSGDLLFNRGTVLLTAAVSPLFTANDVTFNSFGRLQLQSVNGSTLTRTGTLTYAAGAVGEFSVDNTSGTLGANYLVDQNGALTLGTGGTGATMRVFLADAASAVNITGGVTLGGNSSISVSGGDADSLLNISSVISDGGSGYALAINDDAGAWAQTNTIVRLSNLNTFSGNFALGEGVAEFDTVTGISGAASSLGQGTAITMGGGNLRFIGSASQTTDRPISTTASSTLSANGTGGAKITYTGAITQALDNSLTLSGLAGSEGEITAGITQATGTASDLTVNGGTWTLSGAASTISDDVTVSGTTTILNLNTAGVLAFGSSTGNLLQITNGGTVNLGATGTMTGFADTGVYLAQSAGGAEAVLNMNGFNQTFLRLILGERLADRSGRIDGTGTLTIDGATGIELYRGTINANLASTAATPFNKYGPGIVTLKGDNSGIATTTAAIINEGTLVLDYTASNTTKLRAASQLDMRGSNLSLIGNNGAATAQTVASFTLGSGGANVITVTPGTGQEAVLNLNAITRAINAQDGTIRFNLPTGTQSVTNGITTDTLNTIGTAPNAILGAWATVNDGTGTFFARNATNAVDGNIVAAATTLQDAAGSWLTGENISDSAGFTGTVDKSYINSLRFNAAAGSDISLATTGVLGINSGGILVTNNVGGTPSLSSGTLFSGTVVATPELVITQDSTAAFEINSDIRINHIVFKTGNGTLQLSGNNVYTGLTEIQNGTLQVSGGNGIGDTSLVTLSASSNSTLELLSNETIGRLQGGRRNDNSDYGMVDVGSFALSINQSASTVYSGRFTGSGAIILNTGSTGNLNYNGQTSTGLFTGSVTVNGGLFQLSGDTARLGSATAFTINGAGNFLLDNDAANNTTDRISDTATFTLNSAAGAFSGETRPRGLAMRNNDDDDAVETVGATTFNSGANYLSLEASGGTSAQSRIVSTGWTRNNSATVNVRGRNLGATADAAGRSQFKVTDANDAAMLAANVGGGGVIGGTAKNVSIIPWAIGEATTAGLADGNMGNTFLSYVDNRGFVPLSLTNEFSIFSAAATGDNVRESLGADLTGIAGATVNSLILNNTAFAGLDVTGTGSGQTLAITSGALMFTVTGGVASTAYDTTLGGFNSGITVGGTNEYVISVVNPSSATTTSTLTATIASPLTSSADITKSGRGTLILNQVNTAGGGARRTTLNEGTLEIADLDNIGGGTGGLVFAGGTLRLGAGLTDDISTRTISFLLGGGSLDTNGIDLALANSLGSGAGAFTKLGVGNLTLNATSTRTGATTLTTGTITIGAANALGVGGNLSIGAGATLALGANNISHGLVSTSGASPAITGTGTITASTGFSLNHTGDTAINAILAGNGGVLKSQANIVTLTGLSTYTGTTEIQAGTLSINSITNVGGGASALGNASNAETGIIRMGLTTAATTLQYTGTGHSSNRVVGMQGTTGGVTLDADGTGALGLGGARFEMAGNKTLTLRGSSDPALVNSIGAIQENGGVLTLNKTDANTWMVNQASSYTGATQIDQGTLKIGINDALPTTTTVRVGTGTTAGTLDLNGFDQTIGSLTVQSTTNTVTNQILVTTGKTLTVNGAVTLGVDANASSTAVTASGGGSIVVNSAGTNFQVGGATGGTNENNVDVDFTGLTNFTANLGSGTFRLGDNNTGTTLNPSTFKLAANNTITAANFRIGDGSGGGSIHTLTLGSGTNLINADTINVGSAGATIRSSGSVIFDAGDTTGAVTIRASDGSGRAAINMVNTTGTTATDISSSIDLTGHTADVSASTVTMASRTQGANAATATLSFNQGALDVTTLNMASRASTSTGNATATVNLGDSVAPGTPTVAIGALNMAVNTSAGGTVLADLNITGGNVTLGTGSGTAVNMANAVSGRTATSNMVITGGTVEVTGNIVRTGGAGTENATVTVNGGTLDLNGNSIGGGSAAITLAAQSGTLRNLGELNGGGTLTKTTAGVLVLEGPNTYTGKTIIDAGKLSISDETNLGANPGAPTADQLTLNGGTLLTTANLTLDDSNRGITVSAASSIETNAGTTATISSTILGSANLTKEGDGTLNFTSAQAGYTGSVTINGGTLLATNTTGSATGSGPVTVSATGTLGGTGSIIAGSNNNITINGTLDAGMPAASSGTALALTVGGTGSLALNGATQFQLFTNINTGTLNGNTAADQLVVNAPDWSNLIFGGSSTLTITTGLTATSFVAGDSWKIFDWLGVAAGSTPVQGTNGFNAISAPTLDVNLDWDYSALFTTGTISIIVVPEPSRALLLLLGLLGLMMRRRRN